MSARDFFADTAFRWNAATIHFFLAPGFAYLNGLNPQMIHGSL